MALEDTTAVASIHAAAFPRQLHSEEWIRAKYRAYPKMQYYVAEVDSEIFSFIHWTQKRHCKLNCVNTSAII